MSYNRKKVKRNVAFAVLAGASVAVLTGVTLSLTHASGNSAGQGKVTITVATVNNPQMIQMEHLTKYFEAANPNIAVKYDVMPENVLRSKVTEDVATGAGKFDVVTIGSYEAPLWAKNGWLVNLSNEMNSQGAAAVKSYNVNDLLKPIRSALSYRNALYALPFYGESSMMMYRKDIFKKDHLVMPLHPTWSQVQHFAAVIKKDNKGITPIVLRGLPGWGEQLAPLDTVINAFGGEWFNMKWQPQFNNPATKKAVAFYVNLLRKYGETGAAADGFVECETLWSQGKGAMWVDATSAAPDFANSPVAAKTGYAYAPTQVTSRGSHWLWSWALALDAAGKNQTAATKFIMWATSKQYAKLVVQHYGLAQSPPGTRYSILNNPALQKVAPWTRIEVNSIDTADPLHPTLHPVPYTGVQYVDITPFEGLGTQVSQDFAAAITGSTSVASALSKAQQQATQTMQQNGYLK
ncbi:MAG: ABC transporter substrate-binding protein [Bacilli bacterium]